MDDAVSTLLEGIADAAFASEASGRVIGWNAAAERLLGIPASEALGSGCAALLQGTTPQGVPVCTSPCPLLEALPSSSCGLATTAPMPVHPDLTLRRGDGGRADVRVVAVPLTVGGAPLLLHLLREREEPAVDPLTGCLRPWSFETRAVRLQDHAARFSEALAAAFVDIDDLEAINREHGRAVGDRVVAGVGAYLRHGRRDDAVCRWGGDEFALVLPAMTAGAAARRLRATLDVVSDHVRAGDRPVSLSAGVVDLDPRTPLSRGLHRAARLAATARERGGGRVLAATHG